MRTLATTIIIVDVTTIMVGLGRNNMIEPIEKCLRCGHEWTRRTEKPGKCPKCTSRIWFKSRTKAPIYNKQEEEPIKEIEVLPTIETPSQENILTPKKLKLR